MRREKGLPMHQPMPLTDLAGKSMRVRDCWDAGLLVPVAMLTSHDHLLRLIQAEHQNASVYGTFSQIFSDLDSSMTTVFSKMAAEEQRHTSVLTWCYRRRFGSEPPIVQSCGKFDSKTLHQGLQAGLCRLLREKVAENRRSNRFALKRAVDFATGFTRLLRYHRQGTAKSGEFLP